MSSNDAEKALYQDLLSIYARAGAEVTYETDDGRIKPYWAKRFLQAVKRAEKNGEIFQFVTRLIRQEEPSRGFLILKKAGRLDLTVEALIIDQRKPYNKEIPFELIEISRLRLRDHDFPDAFGREPSGIESEVQEETPKRSAAPFSSLRDTSFDIRVTIDSKGSVSLALI